MSKFVIFASARTGSTSLADLLSTSRDVKLCFEPFNADFPKWKLGNKNYAKLVKDKNSLNKSLDELFTIYNALKVLDYQLPEKIYFELLARQDIKIIFLRRKNLFDLAVSDLVAHQVREWRKNKSLSIYKNLKALDEKEFSGKIKYIKHLNTVFNGFLERNRKGDYLQLWNEDLYTEDFKNNKKTLQKICKFLEISLPPDHAIKKHMTPSKAKINYKNIYSKIPNYEELKEKFES